MKIKSKFDGNSYSKGNIELEEFSCLNKDKLLKILSWRNSDDIRQHMKNSDIISLEEHFKFVGSLKSNNSSSYWLVKRKGIDCGVTNLHLESSEAKEAEWGYYLSPEFRGSGLGLEIGFESIHIFFENFGLDTLYGLVKESNKENIKIQERFNFQSQKSERSGYLKFVLSNDQYNRLPKTYKQFKVSLLNEKKSK